MERLWIFAIIERAIVAVAGQASITVQGITPCDGIGDWLTGCGDTISSMFSNIVFGTVSGAPDMANLLLGVAFNGLLIIAVVKWGRGVMDL